MVPLLPHHCPGLAAWDAARWRAGGRGLQLSDQRSLQMQSASWVSSVSSPYGGMRCRGHCRQLAAPESKAPMRAVPAPSCSP